MADLLAFLNAFRKMIGEHSIAFIALSFATLAFSSRLSGDAPAALRQTLPVVAGLLFVIGVLVALLRLFASAFQHRPARGLIDGLAAGLLAGVLGGYFGFGYHTGPDYVDHPYYRIVVCLLFATPIGGVLGLAVDLFHPDRKIPWQQWIGAIILSFAILFAFVGLGIFFFTPVMQGAGFMLGDFQLVFEFGIAILLAIMAISFRWPMCKCVSRSLLLIVSVVAARTATFIVYAEVPGQGKVRLCFRMFLDNLAGHCELAVSVSFFMLWFIATYGAVVLSHPLNRWLDRKFGVTGPANKTIHASR